MSQTSINVPTPRRVDLEQDTLSITTTDADLSPIYASLTTNLGLIGDNTNSITSLRNDLTSNVASITANQGSITQVATDLSNNVLSISSITGSISTINGSLSAHQASLSSHALTLTAHATAINDLDTNLGDITSSVIINALNIGSLSTSCSALSSDLGDITSSVISNTLKIGSLTNAVALNTGSITTLTDRLNTISYTDINGTIPNADVAVKEITADKVFYDTGAKTPIGGSTYPTDTLGLELDYQNRNWFDLISSTYALASMAGALNTLIGDPLSITSLAAIQAEQLIQNQRLFDLDAPTTGRVSVNEDNISTLSSSVGLLQGKTTALSHNGTISTISGDLSITGSIVNSGYTYLEDSVGVLQGKTIEISYDDLNTITSITNNVYVGNDITIGGSITNTGFQAVQTRTTDLGYNNLTTTIFNTLSVDNIINPELQNATTDIDDLETKTQNITSDGVNQTTITGQLEAGEITCDTLAFGDPPTFLSDLKTKLTDITYAGLTTTIANTLSAGSYLNLPPYPDLTALEEKTQYQSSTGNGTTTWSGNLIYETNKNVSLQFTNLNAKTEKISVASGLTTITNGLSLTAGDMLIHGAEQLRIGSLGAAGNTGVRLLNAAGAVSLDAQGTTFTIKGNATNGNTERLRLDLATGNFGIAQAAPAEKLDVVGNAKISGTLNAGNTTLGTLNATNGTYSGTLSATLFRGVGATADQSGFLNTDPDASFVGFIYTRAIVNEAERGAGPAAITFGDGSSLGNDQISLITNGDKRVYITNSKVECFNDVYAPAGKSFYVGGPTTTTNGMRFHYTSNEGYIDLNGTGSIHFRMNNTDGGTERASIGPSGMTLAGNISSAFNTDSTSFFGRASIGYAGYGDYAAFSHVDRDFAGNYALLQYADGTTYLNCSNGKNIYLREDNVDILRIRRDNFIFIGTKATIEIYDVAPGAFSNELRIENTSGFGRITYTSSIREHKRDIEDADGDFIKNVVENLRPRFFRYIDDLVSQESKKQWSQIGLIADETNEVDPRLATFDANGETLTGVDYARVSVYLLAYIQQTLNPKIAELESKIDAILNRLNAEVQVA